MKNFVSEGRSLDLIAPVGGVIAGLGVLIGAAFVVAATTADAGNVFPGYRTGIFDLAAEGEVAGQDMAVGDVAYFDAGQSRITKTVAGNTPVGVVVLAKLTDDTVVRVVLVPRISEKAARIAALGGVLTGNVTGAMANVSALNCAGDATPTADQVDTAIASLATAIDLQLKELQTAVNAIINA